MKPVSNKEEPVSASPSAKPMKMKSALQIGVVLAVLVGTIGFVTYITQYANRGPEISKETSSEPAVEPIRYAFLDPPVREVEIFAENYQDYYFANPTSQPVTMRLNSRSCVCVHTVEIATWPFREALGSVLAIASTNVLESLGALSAEQPRSWLELPDIRVKQGEVRIPAADGPFPSLGILRAKWQARTLSPQGLESVKLDVVSQIGNSAGFKRQLSVNFLVMHAFSFFPHSLDAKE